ncbi:Glutathione S-transferase L3, partial [Mucuna pruriens]
MATSGVQALSPPALTSTSDPPTLFDGTTSYFSPYAQRVWIARNYKGLQDKIKLVPIDLQDRPAWYKEKVYPENKVPSLEHNGKVLGESLDLIKYVDANFEGTSLFPSDSAKKEFGEHLISHSDTFNGDLSSSLRGDPALQARTGTALDYLENALGKFDDGPFLLGQFSLVDIAYIPFVERFQILFAEHFKHDITEGRPKLASWIEEVNKIDAYTQTRIDPQKIVDKYNKRYLGLQDTINLVPIDLQDRPAWYKEKVYPENKVPSLEHNGKVLGESIDLIKYVDANFEGTSLFPNDPAKKEFGEQLISHVDTFTKELFSSLKGDTVQQSSPSFEYLENALGKFDDGPFLLGQFSLVDVAYIPFVERFHIVLAEVFKHDVTEGRPKLATWIEEVNKINAYTETRVDPQEIVDLFKKRFLNRLTSGLQAVRPPPLTSTSDPPPLFDGTTSYSCPYAQRVWITRNYKGLQDKIKLVPIDLQDRPAWYKEQVYPENKVPSLEHNGKVLGESIDLIKYVDANFEGTSLFPSDSAKEEFCEHLISHVDTFNSELYSSLKGDPVLQASPAFEYLENALGKFDDGPFFLGQFSLVDIAYIPFVERFQIVFAELFKHDITEGRPKLASWIEEVNKIDAYTQTRIDPQEIADRYKKRFLCI